MDSDVQKMIFALIYYTLQSLSVYVTNVIPVSFDAMLRYLPLYRSEVFAQLTQFQRIMTRRKAALHQYTKLNRCKVFTQSL